MTCRHFLQLRDAFLDRELSESQNAEVHAHLLQCPECQRQIEVLRACGDMIAMDRRGPCLSADFADRVMAAMPARRGVISPRRQRWLLVRRWVEYGLAPAAAAVLAFAIVLAPATTPKPAARVLGSQQTLPDAIAQDVADDAVSSVEKVGRLPEQVKKMCAQTIENAHHSLVPRHDDQADVSEFDREGLFMYDILGPFFDLFSPPVSGPTTADDIERI